LEEGSGDNSGDVVGSVIEVSVLKN
jgi:hypothetical protein